MDIQALEEIIESQEGEHYRLVAYATQFHDIKILYFEDKTPAFVLNGATEENYLDRFYLGVDMDDKLIRLIPLSRAQEYLPHKPRIVLECEPYLMQKGYSFLTNEGGEIRISRDYIFNARRATSGQKPRPSVETRLTLMDKKGRLVERTILGLEQLSDTSYHYLPLKIEFCWENNNFRCCIMQ